MEATSATSPCKSSCLRKNTAGIWVWLTLRTAGVSLLLLGQSRSVSWKYLLYYFHKGTNVSVFYDRINLWMHARSFLCLSTSFSLFIISIRAYSFVTIRVFILLLYSWDYSEVHSFCRSTSRSGTNYKFSVFFLVSNPLTFMVKRGLQSHCSVQCCCLRRWVQQPFWFGSWNLRRKNFQNTVARWLSGRVTFTDLMQMFPCPEL